MTGRGPSHSRQSSRDRSNISSECEEMETTATSSRMSLKRQKSKEEQSKQKKKAKNPDEIKSDVEIIEKNIEKNSEDKTNYNHNDFINMFESIYNTISELKVIVMSRTTTKENKLQKFENITKHLHVESSKFLENLKNHEQDESVTNSTILKSIETRLTNIEKNSTKSNAPTFAQIVKHTVNLNESENIQLKQRHKLFITSQNPKDSAESITTILKQNVDPIKHKIKIANGIKKLGPKTVLVELENKFELIEYKKKIEKIKEHKIVGKEETRLSPTLILLNIEKEIKPEQISDAIISQNESIDELINNNTWDEEIPIIKYKFSKPSKLTDRYHAILQLHPKIFAHIKNKLSYKLYLGYQQIKTDMYLQPMICGKCLSVGHTTNKCSQTILTCSHCSETGHTYRNCPHKNNPEMKKCVNCVRYNNNSVNNPNAKKRDVKHYANDPNICQNYKFAMERLISKIDFS